MLDARDTKMRNNPMAEERQQREEGLQNCCKALDDAVCRSFEGTGTLPLDKKNWGEHDVCLQVPEGPLYGEIHLVQFGLRGQK